MNFSIGKKVRLNHTGEEGIITALLDGGMVMVKLPGDIEIPIAEEDLKLVAQQPVLKKTTKPIAPVKKEAEPVIEKNIPGPKTQYAILKGQGIQLAFEPLLRGDGTTDRFRVFLINDLPYDALYTFELSFIEGPPLESDGILKSGDVLEIGMMGYDQLNDAPEVEMDAWQLTTEGKGDRLYKLLKIKPKQFFSRLLTAPLLDKPVHLFTLFESLEPGKPDKNGEDLKNYTQRVIQPSKFRYSGSVLNSRDRDDLASFEPEVDLHIEKLTENHRKMGTAEILRLQMRVFEDFINKAIRLGVPQVYIIHGIGKGRLRDEIATSLLKNTEVQSFKNEYHPKYGHGATEVNFI